MEAPRPSLPWRVQTPRRWLELTDEPLDVGLVYDFLNRTDAGGIVLFSGTVRTYSSEMDQVSAIHYEAYLDLVADRLGEIATSIEETFEEVRSLVIMHRLGEVPTGASSVLVGCSAGHRDAAFGASRYGIDTIKVAVPIWKQEKNQQGAQWSSSATPLQDIPTPMKGSHG
ncbi:MAG: molybdenum cofactor biosynthesis protein MoaE [Ferrimicrobium sp.]|uniref:molybdenum cofactor biosynthesis protein MoaE n=1 Tax=Ferrimicrobium sp. TaxID=2926050 RepID=UPI0026110A64|nr:molybdenum cofactor biosynthesis protein MoaE [Ferrimicrobium sp.]